MSSDAQNDRLNLLGSNRRSITPSSSQSARKRPRRGPNLEKKASSSSLQLGTSENASPSRDALGLKGLMGQMPTREECAESHQQVLIAQERMTSQMTEAMSNIILSNRAMEIAAKKEIAIEEFQYKTRLARGNMVVDLIRAGRSPEEARAIAHKEFPDK